MFVNNLLNNISYFILMQWEKQELLQQSPQKDLIAHV